MNKMIFAVLCMMAANPIANAFAGIHMPFFGGALGSLLLLIGVLVFFIYPILRFFRWLSALEDRESTTQRRKERVSNGVDRK
uniref:Uncharacterized protein n=2 Tax=unclassified bacterial viruses TaxID=12333 RepID=A0AAU6VYN3_9VIRU